MHGLRAGDGVLIGQLKMALRCQLYLFIYLFTDRLVHSTQSLRDPAQISRASCSVFYLSYLFLFLFIYFIPITLLLLHLNFPNGINTSLSIYLSI